MKNPSGSGEKTIQKEIDKQDGAPAQKIINFIEQCFQIKMSDMSRNHGKPKPCHECREPFDYLDPKQVWDDEVDFDKQLCVKCGFSNAQRFAKIPKIYLGCDLLDEKQFPDMDAKKYQLLIENSFFFYGPTGTGKTFYATAVLNQLLKNSHKKALFAEFHDFLRAIRGANKPPRYFPEELVMRNYAQVPILLLDDIFGSKDDDKPTENENSILYQLIRDRNNNHLKTLITCNYSLKDLEDKGFNARITSRIAELCLEAPINGADRRMTIEEKV